MGRGSLTRFLLVLAMVAQAQAAQWICVRSANFELYTSDSEKAARDTLIVFEEARSAFQDLIGIKFPDRPPATVVAFRDAEEYAPYAPHKDIPAYYLSVGPLDLIVLQDLTPAHHSLALHEYTHLVIHQAGMKLPVWLDEGFAELYGTMMPAGNKIVVGRVIPERLAGAQQGLLDLNKVLSVSRSSSSFHEPGLALAFYAESWALVHMLKFSKAYSSKFDTLLDAIGQGEPSSHALERVYGKPLASIQADLQTYVHGNHFAEGVIHAKMERPAREPELVSKDPVDIGVLLAEVEARTHPAMALAALQKLAKDNPGNVAPLNALAWQYLNGPDPKMAIATFQQALKAGTRDAALCFQYAVKLHRWIPEYDYIAALRRAAEINPDFSEAQEELAAYAFNNHDYAEAVNRLHQVKKLGRSQAFMYYKALSFAAYQTGNMQEAKSAAEKAGQFAKSPEEQSQARDLVRIINGASTR